MTISNIIGSRPGAILYLLRNTNTLCSHQSYYPEKKRKGKIHIFLDQLGTILKTGFINDYYFSYGFDVKPRHETKDYFIYGEFKRLRDKFNQQVEINSSFILRNKLAFGFYVNSLGIQTGKNIGLLLGGGKSSFGIGYTKVDYSRQDSSFSPGHLFCQVANRRMWRWNFQVGMPEDRGCYCKWRTFLSTRDRSTMRKRAIPYSEDYRATSRNDTTISFFG